MVITKNGNNVMSYSEMSQKRYNRYAERVTLIVIIIYTILEVGYTALWPERMDWLVRLLSGVFLWTVVSVLFRLRAKGRISNRISAIIVPTLMVFTETLCVVLYLEMDILFFWFYLGCSLICLAYLDKKALLIHIAIACTLGITIIVVLRINVLGTNHTFMQHILQILTYGVLNILLYSICAFSIGQFRGYQRTGQTFDKVLDTTQSYMVITNEKGKVEYISRALSDWLQISKREYALKRPLMDLCHSLELKMMFQEVMESGQNIEWDYEVTIGDVHYWFLLRSSMMGDDQVARTFEFTDITPIMEAKNEAVAATKAKSSFLANMSHEIRTPMNAIIGMTELVMLKPLDKEHLEQMLAIKGAAMSLLNIINDILDFSKIDAEKMEIINKPFDFMSLINDTVNMINIKAEGSGITFTSCISKNLPARIDGDELRIKQALINILNNAVKFTKEGCVALSVTSEAMDGSFIKLIFTVKDTGIGIKKEELSKLFGAFSQLDTHKNRDILGTGLGLCITRRLIELMGGSIKVDSIYGKGSVFSFYIICRNLDAGYVVSLLEPEKYKALCFMPDSYNNDALSSMFIDLGIEHSLCNRLSDFEEKLSDSSITHAFFHKTALYVVKKMSHLQKNINFIMIKGIRDTIKPIPMTVINTPVLITSLVGAIKGSACEDTAPQQQPEVLLGAFSTQKVRALLVDDNSVNLMVAEGMLRQYNIGVVTATGGQDGIDKIQTGEFDIVFMDHMMPGIDGIDATKTIRALGGYFETVPIIALSANAIIGVEKMFIDAGMNGFISKPIIIKQLHNVLLKHLPSEKILLNKGEAN